MLRRALGKTTGRLAGATCAGLAAVFLLANPYRPIATVAATTAVSAESHPIDAERSTLTVFAYKSGLFSAFADDHVIRAPIASGSMATDPPLAVEVSVRSATLTVLDPKLSTDKRADVQTRMLSPEVLDSVKYPNITFTSTAIESAGPDRWTVTGRLSIHGETRSTTFAVARQGGRYRGTLAVSQRDFGIQPISIAGGAVKVKDELKVELDIVAQR
jgi:polyisoprenoid-binding protein YceI